MEVSDSPCLFRAWGHSREEDGGGLTVYRPAGFAFPLSRGRDGMEFRPDGTVVESALAEPTRARRREGFWARLGPNSVSVRVGGPDAPVRRMTIVDCDEQVLRVRWE